MNGKLTEDNLKKALVMRYKKRTISEIAREIGVSTQTIRNWFNRLEERGVSIPRGYNKRSANAIFEKVAKEATEAPDE